MKRQQVEKTQFPYKDVPFTHPISGEKLKYGDMVTGLGGGIPRIMGPDGKIYTYYGSTTVNYLADMAKKPSSR
jgi:hypothetical protein